MTRSEPTSSPRRWLHRGLRIVFRLTTLLLIIAIGVGILAWLRSRTPLEVVPSEAAEFDREAFLAGQYRFPGARWQVVDPAAAGWSQDALADAHRFARDLDTSALMIVHRGVLIAAWGDVGRRENSQSIRKSLLSSLYGAPIADGRIDLDADLKSLGIDDRPPLTDVERDATVRQLLTSRSGVYHSAIYEAGGWKRRKPARGSHPPGTFWYYNNWSFNAAGTIYETATEESLARAFAERIAKPIGMQDYRPRDVVYADRRDLVERIQGNASDHRAYVFMISARDLARFGLLYLADGRWNGHRVLPPGWVDESTFRSARPTLWDGWSMGYMWWVHQPTPETPPRLIARGGRGHRLTVVPELDLVVVHRVPTGGIGLLSQLFRRFVWHPSVGEDAQEELLRRIFRAHPALRGDGRRSASDRSDA